MTPADQFNEDYFGWDVSIDGDRLVSSSVFDDDMGSQSGAAYLFDRIDGVWTEQYKFVASNGESQDQAGQTCCVQGDRVLMSSWYGNDDKGSAWLWQQNGTTWSEVAELQASNGET
ncbi:MAG: hypothetical protein HOJ54_10475, partial [Phycisphaerae bacterium]|nr:hypothetical protein [Phycisphaerae bacterium]